MRKLPKRSGGRSKGAAASQGLAKVGRKTGGAPSWNGRFRSPYAPRGSKGPNRRADMTPEERQMLAGLFQRINANGSAPRDAEAESFINDAVRAAPHAPYVLAQTVLVQQHALEAAAHRIAELEAAAHEAAERQGQGAAFSATSASRYSAAARRPLRLARLRARTPISEARRGAAAGLCRLRLRRNTPLLAPDPGAAALLQPSGGGEASCRTPRRPPRASLAASRSATFSAACSAATRAAACSAARASAARASAAAPRTRRSTISTMSRRTTRDAGQFDPSAPDDAGYIDDSSFDDGSGGGGFDDV